MVAGGVIVVGAFLLTAAAGVRQGLLGRQAAGRTGETRLFCNIGLRFCLLSILGWVGLLFALLLQIDRISRHW
jgi:hypothetical protein